MSYASSDEVKNMAYDQANLREKLELGKHKTYEDVNKPCFDVWNMK